MARSAKDRGKMTPADLPPPIPGMEGPFRYKSGFVLYWDPREGQYYDRGKDLYLEIGEVEGIIGNPNPAAARISDGRLRQILSEARKNHHISTRSLAKVAVQGYGGLDESAPFWGREFERTKERPHVGAKRVLAEIDSGTASTWELEQILSDMERTGNPIPNRGPLTRSKQWMGSAITRKGKLGGKGFLSRPVAEQHRILAGCVNEYGYRSCLGSVMVLERIPRTQAKYGRNLRNLRVWLVKTYGGPGSFGPRAGQLPRERGGRPAPGNPDFSLSPTQKRAIDHYYAKDPEWAHGTDPGYLVEYLLETGVLSEEEWKRHGFRAVEDAVGQHAEEREKRKANPGDPFLLVPELTDCEACMVKPNPEFREALSGAWKVTKRAAQAGYRGVRAGSKAAAEDWSATTPELVISIRAEDHEYGKQGTKLIKIGRKLFYRDKSGVHAAHAKRFGADYHVDEEGGGEVARIDAARWKAEWAKAKAVKNPAKDAAIGAGVGALLLGPLGAIAGGYLGSGRGKKKAKKPKRNAAFGRMMRL